jgi:transcriptional regulator with XRE-family HTH domain
MTGWTFAEHFELARSRPEYCSYLASLEFIDQICAEMDARGVSSAELARRMGTSRAYVSKVLAGEAIFTIATMGKLAFALGLRVRADLAPLEEEAQAGAPADQPDPRADKRPPSLRQTA